MRKGTGRRRGPQMARVGGAITGGPSKEMGARPVNPAAVLARIRGRGMRRPVRRMM